MFFNWRATWSPARRHTVRGPMKTTADVEMWQEEPPAPRVSTQRLFRFCHLTQALPRPGECSTTEWHPYFCPHRVILLLFRQEFYGVATTHLFPGVPTSVLFPVGLCQILSKPLPLFPNAPPRREHNAFLGGHLLKTWLQTSRVLTFFLAFVWKILPLEKNFLRVSTIFTNI